MTLHFFNESDPAGPKSDVLRLLLKRLHVFHNLKQAPPAAMQTSFKYCFCL